MHLTNKKKRYDSVAIACLFAGYQLTQPEGQAQAYLTQGAEVEADKGCSSGSPCIRLVDGDFETMAHSTSTTGPHWMKIKMEREYEVETILVQNRDTITNADFIARINPSTVTVGNLEDVSANASCGGTLTSSAIFACGLKGTIIGIRQDNT